VTTVIRAVDVPTAARHEYWLDVVGGLLGPIDIRPGELGGCDQVLLGTAGRFRWPS
jgi:hypothetical protein